MSMGEEGGDEVGMGWGLGGDGGGGGDEGVHGGGGRGVHECNHSSSDDGDDVHG